MLCQKLGGLKQPSPRRPPLSRDTALSTSPKPGAAVQRLQGRKPRRTLERVMTDERSGSRRIPSLARSATEPSLPRLKREVSDVSLASIPLNRVAMHKRYSQREVDLDAASTANEAKLKKKAKVEQELHSAIAALKKPNPRMAVKELVEHAEKRAAGSHLRSKCTCSRVHCHLLSLCRAYQSHSQTSHTRCANHSHAEQQSAERRIRWSLPCPPIEQKSPIHSHRRNSTFERFPNNRLI